MKAHFLDPTFKGLYQANAFDMLLLIPYFIVLVLLAIYGMHRYQLVYLYYKHRKNKVTEPESHFAELPRVTIQLPIFNEEYVVDRLVDCVCKIEYPRDRLQIQVLDDSTDETVEVARSVVERYAAMGHDITHHHRTNREGYKAGALDAGLKTATGEFVAIFDADFMPQPEWLMQVIHHFANPDDRHGANSLDALEPRLFVSHRSGSHSARRPLRAGTWRPFARRRLLQLQRYRGNVAPQGH